MSDISRIAWAVATLALILGSVELAAAQTRLMPLGNSITQGVNGYASYRYELWFDLLAGGYDVDFVGRRDFTDTGDPILSWYPQYLTTFDRDHEAYSGWRTDQIASIILDATTTTQPEIVLLHLGTNDVGQMGAAGVANADTSLREIIGTIRSVVPDVTILFAHIIPIGSGSGYSVNAAYVDSLNAVITTIVADSNTVDSPIILVDHNTSFDLGSMMQSDGLHPNLFGEAHMAGVWLAALSPLLTPGNIRPTVSVTSPEDGAKYSVPAVITVTSDADDTDGSVTQVSFYADSTLIEADSTSPYSATWSWPQAGSYDLTAVAEDDSGATTTSAAVGVLVLPFPGGVPRAVVNPSFEDPALADGALAEGPGVIGGWTFSGTASTYTGIFNPPAGSYPGAGGNGTPTGADSTNAAYLFNAGGVFDSVSAVQVLTDTLAEATEYLLTVAIGRFLPDQPYAFSTYGGYRIELLAGSTMIASSVDEVNPPTGEFRDAFAHVSSNDVDSTLIGQPLSIRLDISADTGPRSTHFDNIRLVCRDAPTAARPTRARASIDLRVSPNPFNPATLVTYVVPRAGPVSLRLYDVRGRLVDRLIENRRHDAGEYSFFYEAAGATGVYFLRVEASGAARAVKIVLMK